AMAAVAYTSTRSRRRLYLSQALQERRERKEIPQTERDEVREILRVWGYHDADLEELVERICRNPTAELEFMMSFELKLSPVEAGAPKASLDIRLRIELDAKLVPVRPVLHDTAQPIQPALFEADRRPGGVGESPRARGEQPRLADAGRCLPLAQRVDSLDVELSAEPGSHRGRGGVGDLRVTAATAFDLGDVWRRETLSSDEMEPVDGPRDCDGKQSAFLRLVVPRGPPHGFEGIGIFNL